MMESKGVRRRGDFNPDIRTMFSAEQLDKLKKELGIANETAEERAMPELKDKLRKKIVQDLAAKKAGQPAPDDIQGLLRSNAAADFAAEDKEII